MRLVFAAVLLFATGCFAEAAKADPMTTGQLMARCRGLDLSENNQIKLRSNSVGDALDAGKCLGHLEAYVDLASIGLPEAPHPLGVCPPYQNNISATELGQMFMQYASRNPGELRMPAALVVAKILAEKFPCHK